MVWKTIDSELCTFVKRSFFRSVECEGIVKIQEHSETKEKRAVLVSEDGGYRNLDLEWSLKQIEAKRPSISSFDKYNNLEIDNYIGRG